VEVQELLLAAGEPSHVNNPYGVDPHSLERRTMSNRRNYELSVVLEADKAAIKEVINAWRQKQAILTVQPLIISRVSPRLAVTGYQVHGIFNASDPTS
jgi:hypothetical protein